MLTLRAFSISDGRYPILRRRSSSIGDGFELVRLHASDSANLIRTYLPYQSLAYPVDNHHRKTLKTKTKTAL
jgi:hypothetical protein